MSERAAGFLPPEQVWEVQMPASEEGLVAERNQRAQQGLRMAVDPPDLGSDPLAALCKKKSLLMIRKRHLN